MAYRLPTFNIMAGIFTPDIPNVPGIPTSAARVVTLCNLAWGKRSNTASSGGTSSPGIPVSCVDLLLPPRTDVRGPQDTVSFDMVEVPHGSGRWYTAVAVDDIGRGFANEHRVAVLFALAGSWVAPYL